MNNYRSRESTPRLIIDSSGALCWPPASSIGNTGKQAETPYTNRKVCRPLASSIGNTGKQAETPYTNRKVCRPLASSIGNTGKRNKNRGH